MRLAIITLSIFLSGCMVLSGRVASIANSAPPNGATFAVFTPEANGEVSSIPDRVIQNLLVEKMTEAGFAPVSEKPEVTVFYKFSITGAGQSISSSPNFVTGGTDISSSARYGRFVSVYVVNSSNNSVYWQAEASSTGPSDDIAYVSMHLVDEIFKSFPKATRRIFYRDYYSP